MPAPFNLESYSYTAHAGPTWAWDVGFARALVARTSPPLHPMRLGPDDLTAWLEHHCKVDTYSLHVTSVNCGRQRFAGSVA
jgi:hypothetical protein